MRGAGNLPRLSTPPMEPEGKVGRRTADRSARCSSNGVDEHSRRRSSTHARNSFCVKQNFRRGSGEDAPLASPLTGEGVLRARNAVSDSTERADQSRRHRFLRKAALMHHRLEKHIILYSRAIRSSPGALFVDKSLYYDRAPCTCRICSC